MIGYRGFFSSGTGFLASSNISEGGYSFVLYSTTFTTTLGSSDGSSNSSMILSIASLKAAG